MKTCPHCGEIVGDSIEVCFCCKYNFKYGRIFHENDSITPQDIVYAIDSPHTSDTIFYTLERHLNKNEIEEALQCIQVNFQCDVETAKQTLKLYKEQIYNKLQQVIQSARNSLTPEQIAYNNAIAREWQNIPKCPTCNSTNIKKISSLSKAGSVAMFGIFSQKVKHQFKCNNCGYEW